ncbi:MAG: universal stress protein [Alphaproteobacteria bacterium]|jgi:nucleotide-binding universal stress UspA family protein|nr:universal stress protein [Alphaproteobacteria bacterium]MBT4086128.1 universal stress protein [Alphaproteobacteria bacterium]MBT4543745.1 universal stress protein [Alphaproteobacteria bacterium]MBT7743990.1 universal stress protein [Alphaproteobacteria bacterium]
MATKTILVPMSGLASTPAPLDAALTVGKRLSAHVEALHVSIDPRDSVAYVGEGMTSAMIEDVMASAEQEANERLARARQRFEAACEANAVARSDGSGQSDDASASFTEVVGREEDYVASKGRLADLIVAGRSESDEDVSLSATLETALMDTGRPVLVVPPGESADHLGTAIAIAWNGSVEAARAVSAAMHFLCEAEKVIVLEVEEAGKHGPSAADVVSYLAQHKVSASSRDIRASAGSVAENLLTAVREENADLLVMGAYTRSRLRRLIFGGVTGDILDNAPVPVLLAH